MSIEQAPFRRYHEEKKIDAFTVRFNKEERLQFEEDKKILQQVKDSTALKQLARIGSFVIHDKKTLAIITVLFKNKKNNSRLNIVEYT